MPQSSRPEQLELISRCVKGVTRRCGSAKRGRKSFRCCWLGADENPRLEWIRRSSAPCGRWAIFWQYWSRCRSNAGSKSTRAAGRTGGAAELIASTNYGYHQRECAKTKTIGVHLTVTPEWCREKPGAGQKRSGRIVNRKVILLNVVLVALAWVGYSGCCAEMGRTVRHEAYGARVITKTGTSTSPISLFRRLRQPIITRRFQNDIFSEEIAIRM